MTEPTVTPATGNPMLRKIGIALALASVLAVLIGLGAPLIAGNFGGDRAPTPVAATPVSPPTGAMASRAERCESCRKQHCPVPLAACDSAECQTLVQCVRDAKCASKQDKLARCYCGNDVSLDDCFFGQGEPSGPCKQLIESGAGSTKPTEVGARYMDPSFLTGKAMQLAFCEFNSCQEDCAP